MYNIQHPHHSPLVIVLLDLRGRRIVITPAVGDGGLFLHGLVVKMMYNLTCKTKLERVVLSRLTHPILFCFVSEQCIKKCVLNLKDYES